ncbi:MAG TPA: rhomboid family intramembrane serine protease [Woeseiaceae bacterium]|nr:rhomboid family intramembrane serine protease [Woeseiaceae bacterium]
MTQFLHQRRPVRDNSAIPNVIFVLLVLNGLLFAAQQFRGDMMLYHFALWPLGSAQVPFRPWQLLTYGFLHDTHGLTHIFFNMFALWMFGRDIERVMGGPRFLAYYLTCVIGAGVVQLFVAALQGGGYPTIGASGGVFGLLLAFAMFFPNRTVILIIPPIPMPAKYFVFFYGLLELYLGISGYSPGVASFAHLGGMLFGFLLLQYWRKQRHR